MVKDPVCGMDVDEASARVTAEYKGKTYYFCCDGCKVNFRQLPEHYLATPNAGKRDANRQVITGDE